MCAIIKLCFMSVGWERLSGTRYEETGSSDKFFLWKRDRCVFSQNIVLKMLNS